MHQNAGTVDPQIATEPVHWSSSARIAFRFLFCYLSLYMLYDLNNQQLLIRYLISGNLTEGFMDPLWHRVVPWVGKHILHLASDITIFTNGSADTTYDYVLLLCELSVAAVATAIWSAIDRKRSNYRTLFGWLSWAGSLVLALEMFFYGMDKLVPVQFGALTLARLSQRVGELTPMGMLWTFMAASKPYTMFAGFTEVLAGILLLFPRLRLLGALLTLGAMSQVFALNMSYDVPVKLGSLHYLLMALLLSAPDAQRLLNILVLNRIATPRALTPLSNRRWVNRAALVLPLLVGVLWLSLMTAFALKRYAKDNPPVAAKSPLYGLWLVDNLSFRGVPRPLLTDKLGGQMKIGSTDTPSELIFDSPGTLIIQFSNGVPDYTDLSLDPVKNTMSLSDPGDPDWKPDFIYRRDGDQLNLQGNMNGNAIAVKLHLLDMDSQLTGRGFHWINETPH
jgi:hypothetical protein